MRWSLILFRTFIRGAVCVVSVAGVLQLIIIIMKRRSCDKTRLRISTFAALKNQRRVNIESVFNDKPGARGFVDLVGWYSPQWPPNDSIWLCSALRFASPTSHLITTWEMKIAGGRIQRSVGKTHGLATRLRATARTRTPAFFLRVSSHKIISARRGEECWMSEQTQTQFAHDEHAEPKLLLCETEIKTNEWRHVQNPCSVQLQCFAFVLVHSSRQCECEFECGCWMEGKNYWLLNSFAHTSHIQLAASTTQQHSQLWQWVLYVVVPPLARRRLGTLTQSMKTRLPPPQRVEFCVCRVVWNFVGETFYIVERRQRTAVGGRVDDPMCGKLRCSTYFAFNVLFFSMKYIYSNVYFKLAICKPLFSYMKYMCLC